MRGSFTAVILVALAFANVALAQSIGGSSGIAALNSSSGNNLGPCGGYLGPGDITAYYTLWNLRAYKASTCGTKLVHACNSTGGIDVGCGDLISSPSTGNLVPATIGGITCPGANCTVDRQYDLTGGNGCASPPCDLVQSIIANRPTLTANCNGTSLPCLVYPAGANYMQLASAQVLAQPLTLVAFASQSAANGGVLITSGSNNPKLVFGSDGTVVAACGSTDVSAGAEVDGSYEGYVLVCNGTPSVLWSSPLAGVGEPSSITSGGTSGLSDNTYVGYNGDMIETEVGVIASAVSPSVAVAILSNMRGYWQANGPPVAGFLPQCSWNGSSCPSGVKFRDFSHLGVPSQVISPGGYAWNTAISNAFFVDPSVNIGGTLYGFTENSVDSTTYGSISAWTSSSLTGTWSSYASNPVITTSANTWKDSQVLAPSVIKPVSTWNLYYCGWNAAHTQRSIGVATSPDLVTWTDYGSNPIISGTGNGACDPSVSIIGGKCYMFISDDYAVGPIKYYTTTDSQCITGWTSQGTALAAAISSDWDYSATGWFEPSVTGVNKDGFCEMTYVVMFSGGIQQMGYAVSSNCSPPWYKYGAGPISTGCVNGCPGNGRIIESGGTLYLFEDNTTIGNGGAQVQTMVDR